MASDDSRLGRTRLDSTLDILSLTHRTDAESSLPEGRRTASYFAMSQSMRAVAEPVALRLG
jgi:hypothetical protein